MTPLEFTLTAAGGVLVGIGLGLLFSWRARKKKH